MLFLGAWWKMIHEKNLSKKISGHFRFKWNTHGSAGKLGVSQRRPCPFLQKISRPIWRLRKQFLLHVSSALFFTDWRQYFVYLGAEPRMESESPSS